MDAKATPFSDKVLDRFLANTAPQDDGCWYWVGYKCKGYGRISISNREMYAHQLSYLLFVDSAAKFSVTSHTDHLCNNKACVNPEHLRLVSARCNILRGTGASAINHAKTKCVNGHPFDSENTRWTYSKRDGGRGVRVCKTCVNATLRRITALSRPVHMQDEEGKVWCGLRGSHRFTWSWNNVTCKRCWKARHRP